MTDTLNLTHIFAKTDKKILGWPIGEHRWAQPTLIGRQCHSVTVLPIASIWHVDGDAHKNNSPHNRAIVTSDMKSVPIIDKFAGRA